MTLPAFDNAIHITDIESAINYWRAQKPSPDGISLCAELQDLSTVYALMVFNHATTVTIEVMPDKARQSWLMWVDTTPDTPCIAICSTSQGDDYCKGCGRTFDEVQHWTEMTPVHKRAVWHRITVDGSAWRFNKYAERRLEAIV